MSHVICLCASKAPSKRRSNVFSRNTLTNVHGWLIFNCCDSNLALIPELIFWEPARYGFARASRAAWDKTTTTLQQAATALDRSLDFAGSCAREWRSWDAVTRLPGEVWLVLYCTVQATGARLACFAGECHAFLLGCDNSPAVSKQLERHATQHSPVVSQK